jgi:hypothetical protein
MDENFSILSLRDWVGMRDLVVVKSGIYRRRRRPRPYFIEGFELVMSEVGEEAECALLTL